ncbi:MAG: hypothetical protein HY706_16580 [Candidatus Hydrogenedentes bacterium]|nr:hypothetical protein [Candidatus Hydrogenedentota bacterium]
MKLGMGFLWLFQGSVCMLGGTYASAAEGESAMDDRVPENVFQGELAAYPGPWSFMLGKSHIILVTDQELEDLSDPDKKLNLGLTREPNEQSLRDVCEAAKTRGARTLIVAFDHFFSQYRPGQEGKPRRLTPDMDEYVERIAKISAFAQQYGLGLELSLLSPLEVGPAYSAQTGESGIWMQYRKGLRDAKSGAFSVQLWRQQRWANNKGPISIEDGGVRVFAFRETPIRGTPYRVVNPEEMVEISEAAQVERFENVIAKAGDFRAERVRVFGIAKTEREDLDRVLVVQTYRVPEMDYFSARALPFLQQLVDKYVNAGVKLNALYSDEMHIQQDWAYFSHHDHGEFALRYVSNGFAEQFAARYGAEYKDFAKYLIYFVHGQEDFTSDLSAKADVMHVFSSNPEDIRRTALFRARYYRFLQDGVVDLFTQAKHYAERRIGYRLEARAHATWAESPTIDHWDSGQQNHAQHQYEYTSNFVWSDTVHQAASACYDYFKWGDFLTGNGNDHCEGGWLDRNYLGLALACSTGILNEVPYSYGAHWGMPHELSRRRSSLMNTYGAAGSPLFGIVQGMQHRDVDVLMLYPLDLVAVDERFGSWMTQYGYANLITEAKLLERGTIENGRIQVAGRTFTTLAATFHPFPSAKLLELMRGFTETGGRVIWSGPPPVLTWESENALGAWQDLFGVDYAPGQNEGLLAPGKEVRFEGILSGIAPQVIPTHFLVDRIYPVKPRENLAPVARVKDMIVGVHRNFPSGGTATFLGYRPRDDQSRSLGYESRNWFEMLATLGAYPPSGKFAGVNDNTEYLSRTTDFLTCRFPNGAVAIARHFRETEEDWPGGFARNEAEDRAYLERVPPPSDKLELREFKVNGHTVTYNGEQAMAFRVNEAGDLVAFAGSGSKEVSINGKTFVFADQELPQIAWAPVPAERRVDGGAILQLMVHGSGTIRIPDAGMPQSLALVVEGPVPGSRDKTIPHRRENGSLTADLMPHTSGRWIYAVLSGN